MGEKCKAAQVKLDDKSVDVKYFQEENWGESSGESSNSNSSSQQLIAKPESKTHLCKQACWEAYFPYNELESLCAMRHLSVKGTSVYKMDSSFVPKLKVFQKNMLQSRRIQNSEKRFCEHIQP